MVAGFVWVLVGMALWHFAVLVPDRFWGGIVGALLSAVAGAMVTGYLLPVPGFTAANPPGMSEAIWPLPGAIAGLVLCWWYGGRREDRDAQSAS
jgi:hypothetical protein